MTDASENHALGAGDKVAVVIVAAGRGRARARPMDRSNIKALAVKPSSHTLETFLAHPRTGVVVVAIHADDHDLFQQAAGVNAERVSVVVGRRQRQASVRLGLLALRSHAPMRF